MKLICTNDFANPLGNPIQIADVKGDDGKTIKQAHVTVNGMECKSHVHKGAIFTIGTAAKFADLSPAEKTLVAQLKVSGKVTEADADSIKEIQAEVEADKRRAEADKARDVRADPMKAIAEVLQGLNETLVGLQAAVAKKG